MKRPKKRNTRAKRMAKESKEQREREDEMTGEKSGVRGKVGEKIE